jgi:hypothetical protein
MATRWLASDRKRLLGELAQFLTIPIGPGPPVTGGP